MGQVLGFSHCQEYGSVASTPDSTPPCTDGGNEESELYELQTAREWSEDEEGDQEDDEGLASSSIWGTPRQHSLELTFSYIAIAEAEAVGASRHHRDRRRGGSRSSRTPLSRTDTLETLLDSPDVEWDPPAFLSPEEDTEVSERRERERVEERTSREEGRREVEQHRQTETSTVQPCLRDPALELQAGDVEIQRGELDTSGPQTPQPPSPSLSPHHQDSTVTERALASQSPQASEPQAAVAASAPEPESPVTMETISVKLLTSVKPRGGLKGETSPASTAAIGLNTQEQIVSEHWFSALNLSEDPTVCTHIVMDLIYWKDTERTGMVLTGLVVVLLSLFQLSIITVVCNLSLAAVCFTISVRIYYKVLHILNWADGEHPFKTYLDMDISLSGEQADYYMQKIIIMFISAIDTLKRLIFVKKIFDSLKFLALVYLVTFFGELFNGLTLIIISVIAVFSLPLFYRQRQEQVDGIFGGIQAHIDNIKDILQRLVHGFGSAHDPTPGGAKLDDTQ